MVPYLETWVRLRWLWALTGLIWLGLVVLLWRGYRPEYHAVARVSVNATVIHLLAPGSLPPEAPLATWRYWSLHDLLRSDAFIERVGKQTALSRYASRPEDRVGLRNYLLSTLSVRVVGPGLLELRFAADPPDLADQVMRAIVTALAESLDEAEQSQGQLALSVYEPHLLAAERAWQAAEAELQAFTRTHPELQVPDSTLVTLPLVPLVELNQLRQRELSARRAYEELKATVDRIQEQSEARGTGLRRSIKLVDAPAVATRPLPAWNTLGLRVVAVTIILLAANLITLVLVTWSEAGLRHWAATPLQVGLPVLGSLPRPHRSVWPGGHRRRTARQRA
jgi:hypothetical protein